jgi:hypothetical protein
VVIVITEEGRWFSQRKEKRMPSAWGITWAWPLEGVFVITEEGRFFSQRKEKRMPSAWGITWAWPLEGVFVITEEGRWFSQRKEKRMPSAWGITWAWPLEVVIVITEEGRFFFAEEGKEDVFGMGNNVGVAAWCGICYHRGREVVFTERRRNLGRMLFAIIKEETRFFSQRKGKRMPTAWGITWLWGVDWGMQGCGRPNTIV